MINKEAGLIRIESIVNLAKDEWIKAANLFYPARDDNGFNERNLSTYLSIEAKKKGAQIFFEVPFNYLVGTKATRGHIDAVWIFKDEMIFLECKRIDGPQDAKSLLRDINRLTEYTLNVKSGLLCYSPKFSHHWLKGNQPPKKLRWLAAAELWDKQGTDQRISKHGWWKSPKHGPSDKWKAITYPTATYKKFHINTYRKQDLHWGMGYGKLAK